jgi:hypothetical protein
MLQGTTGDDQKQPTLRFCSLLPLVVRSLFGSPRQIKQKFKKKLTQIKKN